MGEALVSPARLLVASKNNARVLAPRWTEGLFSPVLRLLEERDGHVAVAPSAQYQDLRLDGSFSAPPLWVPHKGQTTNTGVRFDSINIQVSVGWCFGLMVLGVLLAGPC